MTVEPLLSTKLQAPMARPNTVARRGWSLGSWRVCGLPAA